MSLLVRKYSFDLTGSSARWCPSQPEFSHSTNGFFLSLPYIEPYLIHNVREAASALQQDTPLQEVVKGFIGQEARHAQQHRRYNELLKQSYPGLAAFEARLKARFDEHKRTRTLMWRMAYSAGFEALTYHLVCYLVGKGRSWLDDSDPSVLALTMWHAAEEVEHKSVVYDVYQALGGGYLLRLRGLFAALRDGVTDLRAVARHMLEVDGLTHDPVSQRRLKGLRRTLARALVPRFSTYLKPYYHPSQHEDPVELARWIAADGEGHDQRRLEAATLFTP